ncbi:hypothetical protein AMTR_s00136p00059630 [Amborella trichopoda]|uniref:Uncharacterized protein n=1 Tax=Amborella trichopoda TaxID=13333 RepID=W1NEV5_AMBTC|nr:hypothetical protein AMTR_s00136p00059630 [Amborella trichopoda]
MRGDDALGGKRGVVAKGREREGANEGEQVTGRETKDEATWVVSHWLKHIEDEDKGRPHDEERVEPRVPQSQGKESEADGLGDEWVGFVQWKGGWLEEGRFKLVT